MRNQVAWPVCVLVLAVGGFATWSLTRGQVPSNSPSDSPLPPTAPPANNPKPSSSTTTIGDPKDQGPTGPSSTVPPNIPLVPPVPEPVAEKSNRTPLSQQEQIEFSARRGTEWLFFMNDVTGHFVYGYVPALSSVLEGDHFLRQIGAAYALAQACTVCRRRRRRRPPSRTRGKNMPPAPRMLC